MAIFLYRKLNQCMVKIQIETLKPTNNKYKLASVMESLYSLIALIKAELII